MLYNKQIVHAFLFNIRYYSPEVIDIQLCEEELNNILLMVNNFDIKQKRYGVLILLPMVNNFDIKQKRYGVFILLPMVNNFDIKQKRYGIFTLLYATNTKTRSWRIMAKKTANFGKNTRFFL